MPAGMPAREPVPNADALEQKLLRRAHEIQLTLDGADASEIDDWASAEDEFLREQDDRLAKAE